MPHRDRTLAMVVSLMWALAIAAALVSAALRTGPGARGNGHEHSAASPRAELEADWPRAGGEVVFVAYRT
ncbi:MAG: hypothetical protein ACP5KN_10540 [Armatimonadota bacterium]